MNNQQRKNTICLEARLTRIQVSGVQGMLLSVHIAKKITDMIGDEVIYL